MVDAETLVSAMLDNNHPDEVQGDIYHFSITLEPVTMSVTARRVQACDVTEDMQVIRGKWEIISYDVHEFWA